MDKNKEQIDKIKDQEERMRLRAEIPMLALLENALIMCEDKMDMEFWEITDFFPVVNKERGLVGRKVYEFTGHMSIEEIE